MDEKQIRKSKRINQLTISIITFSLSVCDVGMTNEPLWYTLDNAHALWTISMDHKLFHNKLTVIKSLTSLSESITITDLCKEKKTSETF
jgi:hypothetical protein